MFTSNKCQWRDSWRDFCSVYDSNLDCEGQKTPRRIAPGSERVLVTASEAEAARGKHKGWSIKPERADVA